MKCPYCNKEVDILDRCFINLQAYHQTGGSVLAKTECCGKGVWLKLTQIFSVDKYEGNKKEDDWGLKLNL